MRLRPRLFQRAGKSAFPGTKRPTTLCNAAGSSFPHIQKSGRCDSPHRPRPEACPGQSGLTGSEEDSAANPGRPPADDEAAPHLCFIADA